MTTSGHWQPETAQTLTRLLKSNDDVIALGAFGSLLQPALLDQWSDLDLLLVVRDAALQHFYPSLDWLIPLGSIYAYEQSADHYRCTTRLCLLDFRRLDIIVTTESNLSELEQWSRIPFASGIDLLFSRSNSIKHILTRTFSQPEPPPPSPEAFQQMANDFWFKATVAIAKVARHDFLIALHLALDLVQDCCVLGMMLRDRTEGTTHHRQGGIGNDIVAQLRTTERSYTGTGILDMIAEGARTFDQLAVQWSASYQAKHAPLLAHIAQARKEL